MKIKTYSSFVDGQTLYVFDLDDTLVESPGFEELAIEYLTEDLSISDLLNQSVKKIGVDLDDLQWQDGRVFVKDPQAKIKTFGNWVRKGDRVYLTAPDIFGKIDIGMPTGTKQLSQFYKQVQNKCIVTARSESVRDKIIEVLNRLGLELPKFGLHMLPDGRKDAGSWKGEKIVEIVKEARFNKVIFYDDNSKYIKKATRVVREKLPNLDFTTVKVE